MPTPRKADHLRLVPPETSWLGARIATDLELMDDTELVGTDLVIWYEPAAQQIRAMEPVPHDEPPAVFGAVLKRAMQRAKAEGLPKPTRFVVADQANVEALRSALGAKALVETGSIAELESIAAQFCADYERDNPSPRHSDWGASVEELRAYITSANALYAAAPWTNPDLNVLIAFEAPELGITTGRVSIIGALGESFGYVVFTSVEAYEAWYRAAATMDTRVAPPTLSMNFEPATCLPRSMRDEAIAWGWLFARRDVFPLIMRTGAQRREQPLTRDDVALITALNGALADFAPAETAGEPDGKKRYERPGLPTVLLQAALDEAADDVHSPELEELFGRYASYVEGSSMDEPSQHQTTAAAALLFRFLDDIGVTPDELTASLCSEFMLDYVINEIDGPYALLQRIPEGLVTFLEWLHAEKIVVGNRATSAIKRVRREMPRYLALLARLDPATHPAASRPPRA